MWKLFCSKILTQSLLGMLQRNRVIHDSHGQVLQKMPGLIVVTSVMIIMRLELLRTCCARIYARRLVVRVFAEAASCPMLLSRLLCNLSPLFKKGC